jgi:hypothetical protein
MIERLLKYTIDYTLITNYCKTNDIIINSKLIISKSITIWTQYASQTLH